MKGQVGLKGRILLKKLKLVRKFCEGKALFVEKCADKQKMDEKLLVLHFWGGEWGEKLLVLHFLGGEWGEKIVSFAFLRGGMR